jgi:hypothetical protein
MTGVQRADCRDGVPRTRADVGGADPIWSRAALLLRERDWRCRVEFHISVTHIGPCCCFSNRSYRPRLCSGPGGRAAAAREHPVPVLNLLPGDYVGRMRRAVVSRGDSTAGSVTRGARSTVLTTVVLTTIATAGLDVGCVLVFVAIGRHAHHDGDSLAGISLTAWPFLAGLVIGLLAVRSWRRPASIWPAGVGAWLGAAGAGMVIRVLAGQGTAAAFIAVTFAFLALLMLGWRTVALFSSHFRHTRPVS